MTERLFYIGIKGLIENEVGQVLLLLADVSKHLKNTDPYWDIPGGRIQEGDSIADTLQREIYEETGITITDEPVFLNSVMSKHEIPTDDGKLAGLYLLIYKVTVPADSKIVLSEEHSEYKWFSKAEAAKQLGHKYPAEFTASL